MLPKKIWLQRFKTEVNKVIPFNRAELRGMAHISLKVCKRHLTPREAADDCIYETLLGIRLENSMEAQWAKEDIEQHIMAQS